MGSGHRVLGPGTCQNRKNRMLYMSVRQATKKWSMLAARRSHRPSLLTSLLQYLTSITQQRYTTRERHGPPHFVRASTHLLSTNRRHSKEPLCSNARLYRIASSPLSVVADPSVRSSRQLNNYNFPISSGSRGAYSRIATHENNAESSSARPVPQHAVISTARCTGLHRRRLR